LGTFAFGGQNVGSGKSYLRREAGQDPKDARRLGSAGERTRAHEREQRG